MSGGPELEAGISGIAAGGLHVKVLGIRDGGSQHHFPASSRARGRQSDSPIDVVVHQVAKIAVGGGKRLGCQLCGVQLEHVSSRPIHRRTRRPGCSGDSGCARDSYGDV